MGRLSRSLTKALLTTENLADGELEVEIAVPPNTGANATLHGATPIVVRPGKHSWSQERTPGTRGDVPVKE